MDTLLQALQATDTWLFYASNHGLSNDFLDGLFVLITTTRNWYPVWGLTLLLLAWKGGTKGRWCVLTLVVCIALLDPISNTLLKETIHRLRPFQVLPDVFQLVGTGGGSFPSNHALNSTAAATILSAYYPRWRWLPITLAALIGISRVYCGVHWPSDVLAGALIGFLVAGGFVMLTRRWKNVPSASPRETHSERQLR